MKVVDKSDSFEHDVAISFAGEDRKIADELASALRGKSVRVFYDKFYKSDLWGKKLTKHFREVYGPKARFVILLISKYYPVKDWTDFEFSIARKEAKERKVEFILPVKLDNTKILGIHEDVMYLDFDKERIDGIVKCFLEKLSSKIEEKQHRELFEKILHFKTIEKEIEKRGKFPTKEDFDNGLLHSDEITKEVVKDVLESKRFCLLYGVPASRKTTFSLDLGLDLFNQGYSVGYLEITDKPDINWNDLLQEVKSCGNEKTLFIIDDCHKLTNDEKLVSDFCGFIQGIKRKIHAKFLFVSRDISQEIMDPESNYFDKLKNLVKLTNKEEVFEGIIERFCIHHKIENWKEQIGEVNKIKEEICGNNILILDYLMDTWSKILRENPKKILSEVEKREIYKKNSAKYHFIEEEKEYEDFFKLCAIYQFEIPIYHDFIRNEKIKREYLDIWEHEGLIYRKIPEMGGVYYTVHDNSSFARLLLEAGNYLNILVLERSKSLEEYSAEILKRYLRIWNKNVSQILYPIYKDRRMEIVNRLIQDEKVLTLIKKSLDSAETFQPKTKILTFLNSCRIEENKKTILSEESLKLWKEHLTNIKSLHPFQFFLRALSTFDSEKAKEFLDLVTPEKLAEIYKEVMFKEKKSKTIETVRGIYSILTKLSNKEFLREFLNEFSEREIIDLLNNSKHRQIYEFFKKSLPSNVRNAYRTFLEDYHSEEKILSHYLNSLYLFSMDEELEKELNKGIIPESLKNMFETQNISLSENITITKENNIKWVIIDKEKENVYFLKKEDGKRNIYNSSNLKEAGEFIHISYWVPKVKNAYEKFFEKYLPDKINESSLEDIVEFIDEIRRAKSFEEFAYGKKPLIGKKLGARVLDNIPEEFISQKLEEASSLKSIQKLIRISKEVERWDIISNLIKQIKPIKMREIIEKTEIKDFSHFIWNVSDGLSLPVEYREIINDLDLAEKIRKSPLKDVNFFLWVLFQTVRESQKVFSEDTIINNLKRDDANIGDKLWLVGIFDFANHDLTSRAIKTSKIQATLSESEVEFKNWLEKGRFSKKSPFKVALVLKGFKAVDEKGASSFLNADFDLKEKIINNLKRAEIKNKISEELINEVLGWLLSQVFAKNKKQRVLESFSSVEGALG